jgi:glycosyltransferase involved in cell wall biosynthesis
MKILFALTYYRPHISGLTVYVQRLAEALAVRGHRVTMLTSRHDPALPERETMGGVEVVRIPVAFRISKGVVMPTFPIRAFGMVRAHDIVIGNLPATPFEAVLLPFLARVVARKPIVMVYHCDLNLPVTPFNRLVDGGVWLSNVVAGLLANRLVAYTQDYATHSRLLKRFPKKRVVIPPPVALPTPSPEQVEAFRRRFALQGHCVIGFVARFATEKGVEFALAALPLLRERLPHAMILFAGEYRKVIGEEAYWTRLEPLLRHHAAHWQFTGPLDPTDPTELASFYAACDVTILPSINMTESFGLVQVESMLAGTPVVATNLPGVRQPVLTTGMGRIVPVRDAVALAGAIVEIVQQRDTYRRPREFIAQVYSTARTADEYEGLLERLIASRAKSR